MNKTAMLTPTGEFIESVRKKLQSNPLSLSAPAYRETLSEGPQMLANEAEFMRACYMEGYKRALEDIKEHTADAKNNAQANEPNE